MRDAGEEGGRNGGYGEHGTGGVRRSRYDVRKSVVKCGNGRADAVIVIPSLPHADAVGAALLPLSRSARRAASKHGPTLVGFGSRECV